MRGTKQRVRRDGYQECRSAPFYGLQIPNTSVSIFIICTLNHCYGLFLLMTVTLSRDGIRSRCDGTTIYSME